ncbi:anthranilate synthase component I [bacterium]|nr:anthranilate synthase component I [bacterium]
MFYPDLDKFKELSSQGNLIPVYKEILADLETPLSILKKIDNSANSKNVFLMESVERNENIGRYSFIGSNPRAVIKIKDGNVEIIENNKSTIIESAKNPFNELKNFMGKYNPVSLPELPRFCGGAVGFIGYAMVSYFENIPQENPNDLLLDDAYFMVTDTIIIFDHVMNKIIVVSNAHTNDFPSLEQAYEKAVADINNEIGKLSAFVPAIPCDMTVSTETEKNIHSNMTQDEFEQAVKKAKDYIYAGDIFQVVLSQRFSAQTIASPINLYRALRSINPSPYMYYLSLDDFSIIGSSPEIMVRCEDSAAEIRPIAGTRKRGKTLKEDLELEKDLLADPKECAEHIMLVDLGRNDLGRVCKYNTVHMEQNEFMIIEHYSHVMHIVSDIKGILKDDSNVYELVKASFPAGTVSGAPKIRAMQIIDELENIRRGPYAGAVGYFSFDGNLDSAITIRTIIYKDNKVYIQAGAGIVADSDPANEYFETMNKAKAMIKAVSLAENIENQERKCY